MNTRRSRGRGNPRGGRNPNFRNQQLDSNGPEGRIRGTANQIHDRYIVLARDAQASGDGVLAENLLQHAEHYFRLMTLNGTAQPQTPSQFGMSQGDDDMRDDGESYEGPPQSREQPRREEFRRDAQPRDNREGYQQRDNREGYQQRDNRHGGQRDNYQRDSRDGYQQRDNRESYQRSDNREGYQRDSRDSYQQRDNRQGYQRDGDFGSRQPRSEGGQPRQEADRSSSERSQGDRPNGGDRFQRERPQGDRMRNDRGQGDSPGYSRREFNNNGPDVLPRRLRDADAEQRWPREPANELPSFLAPPPGGGRTTMNGGRPPADEQDVVEAAAYSAPTAEAQSGDVETVQADEAAPGRTRRRREAGEVAEGRAPRPRRRRPAADEAAQGADAAASELPLPEPSAS